MSRFDCPSCGQSLRFRLLRHVPQASGRFTFACAHCGRLLSYTDNVWILQVLFGTPLRRVVTFVAGLVAFSLVAERAGQFWRFLSIAVVAAILAGAYLLSSKPAYEVVRQDGGDDDRSGR